MGKMLVIDGRMAVNGGRMVTTDAADCCCGGETQPDPFTVVATVSEVFDESRDEFNSNSIKVFEGRFHRVYSLSYIARVTYDSQGRQLTDIAPGGSSTLETTGYRKRWNGNGVLVENTDLNGLFTSTVAAQSGYSNGANRNLGVGPATCNKPTAAGCQVNGAPELPVFDPYDTSGDLLSTLVGRVQRSFDDEKWGLAGIETRCPKNGSFAGSQTVGPGFDGFVKTDTWDATVTANSYRMLSSVEETRPVIPFGNGLDRRAQLSLLLVAGPGFDCGPGRVFIPPTDAALTALDAFFGRMA